jgi:hypothetical protein
MLVRLESLGTLKVSKNFSREIYISTQYIRGPGSRINANGEEGLVRENAIMRSRISERACLGLGVLANRAFGKPFGEGKCHVVIDSAQVALDDAT